MRRWLVNVTDRVALRAIVSELPAQMSPVIERTGKLATGGVMWFAFAAGLGVLGPSGRKAARNGLVAYGAASVVSNGPAKWIVERRRPRGLLLTGMPRHGRAPQTSSFPSSHTAGAVAFSIAAGRELPAAAAVLAVAAAAVGLQRVHAVRHYPTDVVGGALVGVAVGTATSVCIHRAERRAHREAAEPKG
jgi:undecaprenyl-diphosphatase